ncbi:holo-ACP synthase [Micrococcus sp.]|uniref:holo-ACP synthase n=1 Tax=Micrococcus sp. TaxID=1271 RepID=UPI002A920E2D|nr:holo-ACP synthase [Micrococcus sp.]MDY6056162.1 holo-ACP synthase [Micrococcus sp.]
MIIGVGVDVVDVPRFRTQLERTPALRARLFTPEERDLPLRSLAARFAAKEAIAKALGAPAGMAWQDCTVPRAAHGDGRPAPRLTGTVAARARELGITHWHLSLSHDGDVATAYVLAEQRPAEPPAPGTGERTATTEEERP